MLGDVDAPNLVLTARHCIAAPSDPAKECSTFGATIDPATFTIHLGVNAIPGALPAAMVKKITVSNTSSMCSYDVALLELDRQLNAKVATLRFTELAPNEATIAVGYGVGGQNEARSARMQRDAKVLGVGPTKIQYTTKENVIIDYDIPKGDIATGESTCYGDSGGPLFDSQGRLVGLTSRGLINYPQNGQHGNGCVDLPSVFASVRFNEQTIREAAKIAGHPLPDVAATTTSNQSASGNDEDIEPQTDDGDDDDVIEETSSSKKRRTTAATQSQGCSATPSSTTTSGAMAIAFLVLALVRSRRAAR